MPHYNRIALIGLGLIGSSLARAIRVSGVAQHIAAFDADAKSLATAKGSGVIDTAATSPEAAAQNADLILLCTPIATYGAIAHAIAPHMKAGALLSDTGSVKQCVIAPIHAALTEAQQQHFVPAHPIAGSEKSGFGAGVADLFQGKKIVLTPTSVTSPEATAALAKFWQACGGIPLIMDANTHDETYALSSHIPQLVSFCYARAHAAHTQKPLAEIMAQSGEEFSGFMRLAGSSPELWADIFLYNKDAIVSHAKRLYSAPSLAPLQTETEIRQWLERIRLTKTKRATFPSAPHTTHTDTFDAFVQLLPKLVACITVESILSIDHIGSGFLGLTQTLLSVDDSFAPLLQSHLTELNQAITLLTKEVRQLCDAIASGDRQAVLKCIRIPSA